jgi:hypothetical protein
MEKTRTITIGNGITLTGGKAVEKYEAEIRKFAEANREYRKTVEDARAEVKAARSNA